MLEALFAFEAVYLFYDVSFFVKHSFVVRKRHIKVPNNYLKTKKHIFNQAIAYAACNVFVVIVFHFLVDFLKSAGVFSSWVFLFLNNNFIFYVFLLEFYLIAYNYVTEESQGIEILDSSQYL